MVGVVSGFTTPGSLAAVIPAGATGSVGVMEPELEIDSVERDTARVAEAVAANRSAAVSACPGWTVADLGVHLGGVHRWVTGIVAEGATTPPPRAESHDSVDPQLDEWLQEGAAQLAGVLRGSDMDTPVWTNSRPRNVRGWSRRMAHETAVHRWDAQSAVGVEADPLDPDLAADGVAEMLEVFVPGVHRRGGVSGAGETFHFHRTDGPGEWLVRFGTDGAEVTTEHTKADVALRGTAPELLLVLWRRRDPSHVEVFGNPEQLARWFQLVPAI